MMATRSKGPLSAKAMADARPTDTHPFLLTRKYGEPVLCDSIATARTKISGDLETLAVHAGRFGTPGDRGRIAVARKDVAVLNDDVDLPYTLSFVTDEHTGVKYEVTVSRR